MANKKYLWLEHFLNSPTIGRSSKRYIFMFLFQLPQVSRLRATVSTVMSGGMPSPAGAASPRWTAAGRGTTSCRTLDSVWMNGTGQALAGTSTYYLQIIHNSLNTHSSMYNKSSFFFIGLVYYLLVVMSFQTHMLLFSFMKHLWTLTVLSIIFVQELHGRSSKILLLLSRKKSGFGTTWKYWQIMGK